MTMHKSEEGKNRSLGLSVDKKREIDPCFIKLSKRVRTISGAVLAPGYHFCPNDHDLLTYLKNKNMEQDLDIVDKVIPEIDVYNYMDLPGDLLNKHLPAGEQQLYFFCPVKKKYGGGSRINRSTEKGNWRITGEDRKLYDMMVRTLVFYDGKQKKTNWMMHEFRLEGAELSQEKQTTNSSIKKATYVLCKLFEKRKPNMKDGQARCSFGKKEMKDSFYTDEIVIVPSSLPKKRSELECKSSNTSALDESLMTSADNNNSSYNVLECTDKPVSFGVKYLPKSSQTAHNMALKDVVTRDLEGPSYLQDKTTDHGGDLGAPDGVWLSDFSDGNIINMKYFENGMCGSEITGNELQNTYDITNFASVKRNESTNPLYLHRKSTFSEEQQSIHMQKVLNAQPADILHMPSASQVARDGASGLGNKNDTSLNSHCIESKLMNFQSGDIYDDSYLCGTGTSQEMDLFAIGNGHAKLQASSDDTKVDLDPFPDSLWPSYGMQSPDIDFSGW